MRLARFSALLICVHLGTGAIAVEPERQLAFADSLHANGEDAFALLEYKRFVFHYPEHAQAPDAFYAVSRIHVSYLGDVAGARLVLQALIAKYPQSAATPKAKQFLDFIEVNSDYQAKPLREWMDADVLVKQKAYSAAADAYASLAAKYPKARLADDAVIEQALLLRDKLQKPADAYKLLAAFPKAFPDSELTVAAAFEAAMSLAAIPGRENDAANALNAFAKKHPQSTHAADALKTALELEKQSYVLKRTFDKGFVRTYKVVKAQAAAGLYTVEVELPIALSQREVKATLEDVLLKESGKRGDPKDTVQIVAYFNYPLTRAGQASWQPGNDPAYEIKEQKSSDVVKDVFLDILRRK